MRNLSTGAIVIPIPMTQDQIDEIVDIESKSNSFGHMVWGEKGPEVTREIASYIRKAISKVVPGIPYEVRFPISDNLVSLYDTYAWNGHATSGGYWPDDFLQVVDRPIPIRTITGEYQTV